MNRVKIITAAFFITSILLITMMASACKPPKKKEKAEEFKGEKVKLEFYVMSKCPYGTLVQRNIKPVLDKLGNQIDFTMDFIATETSPGQFKALHGESEVKGNIAQLCAMKYYPANYKYMDMIECMAKDQKNIPDNWKGCAEKNQMDVEKLRTCIEGEEGKKLLSESVRRAQARRAGASPTIYLANAKYSGGRNSQDFETAVCCALKPDERPSSCPDKLQCPKHVPVDFIVLSDKRCKECGPRVKMMIRNFKDRFPKLNVRELDYSEPDGKQLYERTKTGKLPAYFFDQNVKEDAGYEQIKRWLRPAGEYLALMTGATFDPTKEICDNGIDDTGNGKVDCEDDDCKGQMICRKEIPNSLDLFVMSRCPFGIKAMNAMKPVVDNFKGNLKFNFHFIVDVYDEEEFNSLPEMRKRRCVKKEDGNYYCSLHGEAELNENLREICAIKYYSRGNKYFDYILCRNENIRDPDWKKCAEKAGMDAGRIEKCSTGKEGLELIKKDAKLCDELGISGSPTFIGNNNKKMIIRDRSPEGIKKEICKLNKDLKGCENTLSSDAGKKAPAGSCR